MELWLRETESDDLHINVRVSRVLHQERSPYQDIAIVDTPGLGRALVLDGIVQTTVRDEFYYHEMLAHVPLFSHPCPRRVLVVGGGDGGTVREVLKHRTVQAVDLVEIDERVIDVCRRHLPELSRGLHDPRVNIIVADALEYVKDVTGRYDVALIDSSDPLGPAVGLFNETFYRNVFRALADGGLMVAQTESPFTTPDLVRDTFAAVGRAFVGGAYVYLSPVPIYSLGEWSFTVGTKGPDPRAPRPGVQEPLDFRTRYYTPDVHRAVFALPRYVQELLGLVPPGENAGRGEEEPLAR
ncbi:MAG: polyamine aminopropyltransferase [Firmicutes bacterium]|nr:polyamine aminopropyltransferase [Bacillota bacterium]